MNNYAFWIQWGIVIFVVLTLYVAGKNQMLVREPLLFVLFLLLISFAVVTLFWFLFRQRDENDKQDQAERRSSL